MKQQKPVARRRLAEDSFESTPPNAHIDVANNKNSASKYKDATPSGIAFEERSPTVKRPKKPSVIRAVAPGNDLSSGSLQGSIEEVIGDKEAGFKFPTPPTTKNIAPKKCPK